jgi:hypothetical protein
VMGHSSGPQLDTESPRDLVAEVEGHLRALLRDVLCGYLDADLKAVADDILNESHGEPTGEIEVHDLRAEPAPAPPQAPRFEREPEPEPEAEPMTFEPELEWAEEPDYEPDYEAEPDTAEIDVVAVAAEPVQHELDGVTQSADWGWDDPEDFSAPV